MVQGDTAVEVRRFAVDIEEPLGITFDGKNLWVVENGGSIYCIDRLGTIIKEIAPPVTDPYGITFNGKNLVVTDLSTNLLYQLSRTGNVIAIIPGLGLPVEDICYVGKNIGGRASIIDIIGFTDFIGTPLYSFPTIGTAHGGMAFDGKHLWFGDHDDQVLYKYSQSGTLLRSLLTTGTGISGLTFDGVYLWATAMATAEVIQYRVV